jgi:phosphate-selective porin OprO and OprP
MMDNKEMVLHTGLSFSQGDTPEGQVGISGRTEGRGVTFFRAPTLANAAAAFNGTDRTRFGVEGAVGYGPFKLQAEWLQQSNDFETVVRDYDVDIENWYVQGLWTISGENYADAYKNGSFGSRKPKNDFDPATFSGGLWEVGVRYSEFDASDYNTVGIANGTVDAAFGAATSATKAAGFSKADAWSLGVKFLPNANMRFMLNYVMTDFSDVIGGATGGVIVNQERIDDEKAIIARAQWMF